MVKVNSDIHQNYLETKTIFAISSEEMTLNLNSKHLSLTFRVVVRVQDHHIRMASFWNYKKLIVKINILF